MAEAAAAQRAYAVGDGDDRDIQERGGRARPGLRRRQRRRPDRRPVRRRRRRSRGGQSLPPHGVPAAPGQRVRRHPHLPLAPRPVRPRQRRHARPVGRRRPRLPGRDPRRRGVRGRRPAARRARPPATAPARRARAQHLAGDRQVGDRPHPGGHRRGVRGRSGVRRQRLGRRLGPGPDDPDVAAQPAPATRPGRARARAAPRPGGRRVGLRRNAAQAPRGPAALPEPRHRHRRALVSPLRRGSRRGRRRARDRLRGAGRRGARPGRRDALRRRDRPPLSDDRPCARFHHQVARGARPRRLGARRGCARQPRPDVRRGRPGGGVEPVAQPGRPGRDPGRGLRAAAGRPRRLATRLDAARRADRPAARRRAAGDRGRPAGRTACGRRTRGRRGRGDVRRRDAHRPLPREQRVLRLGHGAAHLHVRERGRAGTSSHGLGRAGARRLRRSDQRVPRPLPEHAAGPAPER